jgi:hypothetical protein
MPVGSHGRYHDCYIFKLPHPGHDVLVPRVASPRGRPKVPRSLELPQAAPLPVKLAHTLVGSLWHDRTHSLMHWQRQPNSSRVQCLQRPTPGPESTGSFTSNEPEPRC